MKILLGKSDPLLHATLFALSVEPLPYVVEDVDGDKMLLSFKDDIPTESLYRLGILTGTFYKVVTGVIRGYKAGNIK